MPWRLTSRHAFAPALWTKPKFKLTKDDKSPTEQVWFAGAHSDVGGGYVNWTQKEPGLSYLPLAWMIQRLNKLVVGTPPIAEPPHPPEIKPAVSPNRRAIVPFYTDDLLTSDGSIPPKPFQSYLSETQHEPWAKLYTVYRRNYRVINQLPLPNVPPEEASGRVPFTDPINEWVHISALKRLKEAKVVTDRGKVLNAVRSAGPYRPYNLLGAIPYLAASYIRKATSRNPWHDLDIAPLVTWKESRLVDWDGEIFDPNDPEDIAAVFGLLPSPDEIGVKKRPTEMEYILDPRHWTPPVAILQSAD
jgi:hypothetical protein